MLLMPLETLKRRQNAHRNCIYVLQAINPSSLPISKKVVHHPKNIPQISPRFKGMGAKNHPVGLLLDLPHDV